MNWGVFFAVIGGAVAVVLVLAAYTYLEDWIGAESAAASAFFALAVVVAAVAGMLP